MAKLQWLARVFGLDGNSRDDDGFDSFEHVDGSRLAADEFHQSDSMRLDALPFPDFAETLPAYSHPATPQVMSSPRPPAPWARHAGQSAH
jgi:hypothetical protein